MSTPPFTKVAFGKKQLLHRREGDTRVRRARLWLGRLKRAQSILNCTEEHFQWRWAATLSAEELSDAQKIRGDHELWLDANMCIAERIRYYREIL